MKTDITLEIERKLWSKYSVGSRCAFEVDIGWGVCDCIVAKQELRWYPALRQHRYAITTMCLEIKTSYNDFKSYHGHNFFGDYNYYVVTKDVYEKIKKNNPDYRVFTKIKLLDKKCDVGIMVYDKDTKVLRIKKPSTYRPYSMNRYDRRPNEFILYQMIWKYMNGYMNRFNS